MYLSRFKWHSAHYINFESYFIVKIINNNNNLLPIEEVGDYCYYYVLIVYKTWFNFNFHVLKFKRFGDLI